MAKVVPTQVEPPQLIKQNTHYESPAFGSQIEAILLKIKSKQEDTDDGHLASVFFWVLPGACSRDAADYCITPSSYVTMSGHSVGTNILLSCFRATCNIFNTPFADVLSR